MWLNCSFLCSACFTSCQVKGLLVTKNNPYPYKRDSVWTKHTLFSWMELRKGKHVVGTPCSLVDLKFPQHSIAQHRETYSLSKSHAISVASCEVRLFLICAYWETNYYIALNNIFFVLVWDWMATFPGLWNSYFLSRFFAENWMWKAIWCTVTTEFPYAGKLISSREPGTLPSLAEMTSHLPMIHSWC